MTQFLANEIETLENLIYPRVTLTSLANASYTATLGTKTVTGTTNSSGAAEIFLPELGTWTISVEDTNRGTKTTTVNASTLGASYSSSVTYALLTVTADVGNTVSATDGTHTVSGTVGSGGTISFSLGVGTWTLTSVSESLSVSDTVTVSASSSSLSKTLKLPTLTVTTDSGNTVTATDGTRTVSGTASGGSVVLKVQTGSWTVTTSNGTVSATSSSTSVSAHSTNYDVSISLPYITVTGDSDNSVTATKGTTVVSGTVGSGGTVVLKVETGTWSLQSTSSSNSNIYVSDTVTVSSNGTGYSKTLKLPTITVTTAANASVSAVKDGVTVSGTADSSGECVLKVGVGTWSVTATSGQNTKTESVTISAHSTNSNLNLAFLTTWQLIQQKVRNGTAATEYPIGTQFNVTKGSDTLVFDVVAHDVATPSDTSKTHSMTLMLHDLLSSSMQFDAVEPNNSNSDRKSYGNDRYSVSNIRQWLNSSGSANNWYTAQHTADAAPSYANVNGWMYDIDSEFLEVVGNTKIKVAKNTITDGGGYEEVTDKFYLPSTTEVGLANENNIAEGVLFPYFNSNNSSRVKNRKGSAYSWWLRTPTSSRASYVRIVGSGGSRKDYYAGGSYGVAPACNII